MEHAIVDKYSDMIAEEVTRYKHELLEYFRAREIHSNPSETIEEDSQLSNINRQLYTTSLAGTTYELEGYSSSESDTTQKVHTLDEDEGDESIERTEIDGRIRLQSDSYEPDQTQNQTFITEDTASAFDSNEIPFYRAFQIPSNLIQSIMFK